MSRYPLYCIALAGAALLGAPLAAAAGPSLYFNDCDHPTQSSFSVLTAGGPDADDCKPDFHKNPNGATTSDAEKVPGNSCHEWLSEDASAAAATYPKDGWAGTIQAVGQIPPSPLYDVSIGYWASGEGKVYHVDGSLAFDVDTTPLPPGVIEDNHGPSDGSFTIPTGAHLLIRICGNPGHSPQDLFVGEGSLFSTPPDGPPFPVPELPTIGLFALGIVAVGWVGFATRGKR